MLAGRTSLPVWRMTTFSLVGLALWAVCPPDLERSVDPHHFIVPYPQSPRTFSPLLSSADPIQPVVLNRKDPPQVFPIFAE
jgi:hypothetical protein